jgi:hypothetical protein
MGADPDTRCFKHDQPCPQVDCTEHPQSDTWCPPSARLTCHSCSWLDNGGVSLEDVIRDVFSRKMYREAMELIKLVDQKRMAKLVKSTPNISWPKSRKRNGGRNKKKRVTVEGRRRNLFHKSFGAII